MGRKRSRPDRVLLLVTGGRDRQLLESWLASEAGYEVVEVAAPEEVDAVEYDVCLLDHASVDRYAERLLARRESAEPCYLPTLLVVPVRRGGHDESGDRNRVLPTDETSRALVDDVVELPVGKATLRRRLESLLRGRHASLDLAAREEQFRELLRLAPEAILLVREGRVRYGNRAAAELFGVDDADELTDRRVTGLASGAGAARLRDVVSAVETDGEPGEFLEVEFVTHDGTERIVEVTGVRVTYEGEPTTQLVVRDVTEERRQREQLGLYARALQAAAQGVAIADARREDDPLIYVNPAFERITGYAAEEVLGWNWRFLHGEGTDPEAVAEIDDAMANRRPASVELRNYRADGTPFWSRLDVIPVRDEAGEVTHFLGLQRDVTRRREREQRVAVLDRVLRHNLRNQLNVVRGEADRILAEEDVAPEETRDAARGILRATDELLDIGDQARRFREIVTGEHRTPSVRDIRETFLASVEDVRAEYPDTTVDLDLPADVRVYAHELVRTALADVVGMLAETDDGAADVVIRATDTSGGSVTLEVVDRSSGFRTTDLDVVANGVETPVSHPQGVELWLLRWSVEHSGGEFDVDTSSDPPLLSLRFRRAEEASNGNAEVSADD